MKCIRSSVSFKMSRRLVIGQCDNGVIHGLLLTPGTATGNPGAARSEADTQAQMQRLPARVKSLLGWHRWHRQGMGEIPQG